MKTLFKKEQLEAFEQVIVRHFGQEVEVLKHNGSAVVVGYSLDVWAECKEKASMSCHSGRYDFTVACNYQEEKELHYKKNLKRQIKQLLISQFGVSPRIIAYNLAHHDKLDFNSDLYRKTGNVCLNI